MTEDLIQKYAAAAVTAASKSSPSASVDDIVSKYAQAALDAKKQKVEQKQQKKEFAKYSPPKRLSFSDVEKIYADSGITPMRRDFFFEEGSSCIQASYFNEPDRKEGTPVAALIALHHKEKPVDFYDESSNHWALGQLSRVTRFSLSYLQGFSSGFDGHPPGHRLCSYDFHCGYADGRIIAALLHKQGKLVAPSREDPWKEVNDRDDLNELIRTQGYWREEFGPKPKYLVETTDLTPERLQELGLGIENIS